MSGNGFKSMKKPIELHGVSVIYATDDEVVNTMEIDFIKDPSVGILWNIGRE